MGPGAPRARPCRRPTSAFAYCCTSSSAVALAISPPAGGSSPARSRRRRPSRPPPSPYSTTNASCSSVTIAVSSRSGSTSTIASISARTRSAIRTSSGGEPAGKRTFRSALSAARRRRPAPASRCPPGASPSGAPRGRPAPARGRSGRARSPAPRGSRPTTRPRPRRARSSMLPVGSGTGGAADSADLGIGVHPRRSARAGRRRPRAAGEALHQRPLRARDAAERGRLGGGGDAARVDRAAHRRRVARGRRDRCGRPTSGSAAVTASPVATRCFANRPSSTRRASSASRSRWLASSRRPTCSHARSTNSSWRSRTTSAPSPAAARLRGSRLSSASQARSAELAGVRHAHDARVPAPVGGRDDDRVVGERRARADARRGRRSPDSSVETAVPGDAGKARADELGRRSAPSSWTVKPGRGVIPNVRPGSETSSGRLPNSWPTGIGVSWRASVSKSPELAVVNANRW